MSTTTELTWDDFFTSHISDEALEIVCGSSATAEPVADTKN
ncbi:MAG: hypothetical protein QOD39_1161 [Mycobacterium sp.]|jgi:hypothetical protein|nr:hypothetical protein [Mycobacterium sp.]